MKKKLIIIAAIILAIIAGLLVYFFVIRDNDKSKKPVKKPSTEVEKITITFNTDGGEDIEEITVKKGSTVTLPEAVKDGYTFNGWQLDDELIDDEYIFEEDVTLKATYEKIKDDEKVMKITFDSKGGSKVNSVTVKCKDDTATLSNLPKATKSGYKFLSWEDKNGKSILNGANLVCSDTLTLYAVYEKNETEETIYFTVTFDSTGGSKVDSIKVECGKTLRLPKTNPTLKDYNFSGWVDINGKSILDGALLTCSDITLYATWTKSTKTYKCESGYELKDGDRCVKLTAANVESYCDGNYKLVNGECVNPSSPNIKGTRTCPSKTFNGWTGTGEYYEEGRCYCAYYNLSSYQGANQLCSDNGGSIVPNLGYKCYKYTRLDYTITCASNEKYFKDQAIAPGSNPGCYQVTAAKTKKTCPDGYTQYSVYGDCAIVKNATLE